MPRFFAVYVAILAAAAMTLLTALGQDIGRDDWSALVVLTLLAVLLDLLEIELLNGIRFTFASAVIFGTVIVSGLPAAVWVAALSNLADSLILGKKLWQIVFNAAQGVLAIWVSGQVFFLLGGHTGQAFQEPLAALIAAGVSFLANILIVAVALLLLRGVPLHRSLRDMLWGQAGLTYLPGQLTGLIGIYLALNRAWVYLGFVMALIILTRETFRSYLSLYSSAEIRRQELSAVLNATGSAIVLRDNTGALRLVNRQFVQWAGLNSGPESEVNAVSEHLIRSTPAGRSLLAAGRAVGNWDKMEPVSGLIPLGLPDVHFADYHRAPVGEGEGPVGVVEVFTDITALKEAEEQLRSANESMLRALTAAIDARDPYTHGHSFSVAEFSVVIARFLGLGEADIARLRYSALLHEIGKLRVDDQVLRKHGPLTPEERAIMMQHPVIGAELLQKAGVFLELIPGVRYHHEWYGGGGYPDGLRGEAIPFDARIIAVADAFDAMTSDRPYRRALTATEALDRIKAGNRVQFDPTVVKAFIRAYEEGEVEKARERLAEVISPSPMPPPETVVSQPVPEAGVIRPVHQRELSILYRVARENYFRMDLPQTLRRILEICADSVGNHVYMVWLTEPQTGKLKLAASLGNTGNLPANAKLEPGQGMIGRVALTGRPVFLDDSQPEPGSLVPLPHTRSVCALPLIHGGSVIGVFDVESPRAGLFNQDDQYLLEALAQQIANAVELVRYHEQLSYAATHDGLTRALNHSAFYQHLTAAVEEARFYGYPLALIILDLNNMKAVNDTYGHLAGDQALREWANFLRSQVRLEDNVARYGGDEFAIIMPRAGRAEAEALIERLHRSSPRSFQLDGRTISLPRASFGLACFPEDGERPAELVAWADHQMYTRKGRSPYLLLGEGGPRFF